MSKWAIGILVIFLALPACISEDEGPDPAVVARGIELKLADYKARRARECREEAFERAVPIADSLVARMAFQLKDSIPRPVRLQKPAKPIFATPPDSLKPKPILQPDTLN
jgi:hypothetical protein